MMVTSYYMYNVAINTDATTFDKWVVLLTLCIITCTYLLLCIIDNQEIIVNIMMIIPISR